KGKPEEADLLALRSLVSSYYGKLNEAENYVSKSRDMFKQQQRSENAAQITTGFAAKQAAFGKCQQAKQSIAAGLALYRGRISLGNAGVTAAICNDTTQAQSLTNDLLKDYPNDTVVVKVIVPLVKAILELNRNNGAGALESLEAGRQYDSGLLAGLSSAYCRGLA